ncbi:hypothetical protein CYMTET_47603 [Cymbomonas tetramitiformis]|uniref:Uncharacterized protein n=1 Tax=Cymbomonas tetramitiformis TaxID=36881 RepID=A0AAE0BV87_9CHLO|nr:hypothetical protein CYMTET_47603 [Cymbomonas tetramitiformis]
MPRVDRTLKSASAGCRCRDAGSGAALGLTMTMRCDAMTMTRHDDDAHSHSSGLITSSSCFITQLQFESVQWSYATLQLSYRPQLQALRALIVYVVVT